MWRAKAKPFLSLFSRSQGVSAEPESCLSYACPKAVFPWDGHGAHWWQVGSMILYKGCRFQSMVWGMLSPACVEPPFS